MQNNTVKSQSLGNLQLFSLSLNLVNLNGLILTIKVMN